MPGANSSSAQQVYSKHEFQLNVQICLPKRLVNNCLYLYLYFSDDEKLFLTEMMDHSEEGKKCDSHTGPCPFVGKHLMAKIELQRKGHPLTDASPVNWAQWVTPKESQLYRIIELSDNDQEEDKYFIKFCSMDKVKINK